MKQFGLFLIRNSASVLAVYFLGWAVWAGLNWDALCLTQKLVMGMFLLFVLHEYEEAYEERFVAMMGRVIGFTPDELPVPGLIHVTADTFIAVMFTLAIVFPEQMWLVLPTFLLGVFEMIVHNWAIVMFRIKGVSPGWYTAMLQGVYSIWALVVILRHVDFDATEWLWAALYLILGFALMEIGALSATGKAFAEIKANAQAFLRKRFG